MKFALLTGATSGRTHGCALNLFSGGAKMTARAIRPPEFMLMIVTLMASVGALGCGGEKATTEKAGEHGAEHAGAMLMVRTEPADVTAGNPIRLHLMLHGPDRVVMKNFEIVHEKKLHLIIASERLDQFSHIHPELDPAGNFTTTFAFPTAGKYRLYADYKPAGKEAGTAIAEILVAGTPVSAPTLVPNAPGRVAGDDLEAEIALGKAEMAGATRISFTLFDRAGKPLGDLEPYLGAMGHLVVLSADGKQYVHAHPIKGNSPANVVKFEAHFPRPGLYKGWGQFQRSGAVHVVPFVVVIR
ncbi:MAG: hypothetical protein ABIS67_02145 [Candidatus Eisenbacteria bacterium]